VDEAAETATEGTETVTDTGDGAGIAQLLTTDGFDFDQVIEMIDGSEMNTLQKTSLKTGLEQARDNPELLQGVLDQIRSAMGL
ncbi:MAG: hypothetical protein AAGK30_06510, partial [Pseudomonadota bacterium]